MCQFIKGVCHLMVTSINIFPREARSVEITFKFLLEASVEWHITLKPVIYVSKFISTGPPDLKW